GIHSDEAVQIAAENGMTAVTNRCIKVEDSIVLRGAGRG
ncbi:CoA-binding protein, partial [Paenibacillus tundrae]|nr:CoA-binding protein [Paenibacillus tundrae]